MPPTGHHAYMIKEGEEEIKKVPMNEWGRYRKSGYAFSTEEKYNAQRVNAPAPDPTEEKPKVSKKTMRRHQTKL